MSFEAAGISFSGGDGVIFGLPQEFPLNQRAKMLAKISSRARHAPENIGGSRSRCLADRGDLAFHIISAVKQQPCALDPARRHFAVASIAGRREARGPKALLKIRPPRRHVARNRASTASTPTRRAPAVATRR